MKTAKRNGKSKNGVVKMALDFVGEHPKVAASAITASAVASSARIASLVLFGNEG